LGVAGAAKLKTQTTTSRYKKVAIAQKLFSIEQPMELNPKIQNCVGDQERRRGIDRALPSANGVSSRVQAAITDVKGKIHGGSGGEMGKLLTKKESAFVSAYPKKGKGWGRLKIPGDHFECQSKLVIEKELGLGVKNHVRGGDRGLNIVLIPTTIGNEESLSRNP